jgi:hypothetical protein
MFELLLQADRALSGGNLDQAERTYWQLSELDPTNAIAIAGLARVALERGDLRLARFFAVRAQVMDPENVAATRIIETIDESVPDADAAPGAEAPEDLALGAARLIEALSRRRVPGDDDADEAPTPEAEPEPELELEDEASMDGEAPESEAEPEAEPAPEPEPEAADDSEAVAIEAVAIEAEPEPELEPGPADEPAEESAEEPPTPSEIADEVSATSEPEPELLPQLPSEPPDRRRFGRELAAAAAEMEAGAAWDSAYRRRPPGRPEFHLTPVPERGRRRFEPEEMKAPALADDPFAAAESEAVIEAVDAVDEVDELDVVAAAQPGSFDSSGAGAIQDVETDAIAWAQPDEALEAVPEVTEAEPIVEPGSGVAPELGRFLELDETDADDSVALRLAVLGYEAGPAIKDETPAVSDEPDDLLDLRMSLLAGEADLGADEDEAASASLFSEPEEIGPETADAEADDLIAMRMAFLAGDARLDAAEIEARGTAHTPAPEPEAEVAPTPEIEPEAEVAPAPEIEPEAVIESEVEAAVELSVGSEAEPAAEVEPEVQSAPPATAESPNAAPAADVPDWELSEREAEAAALREAVAMLLEGAADAGTDAPATSDPAQPDGSAEADKVAEPAGQDSSSEPHRRGFLRRIMGG